MVLKKNISSDNFVVLKTSDTRNFPIGFEWKVAENTYTILEVIDKDPHNRQYRVKDANGTEEIIGDATIIKDLKSYDAKIIKDPNQGDSDAGTGI